MARVMIIGDVGGHPDQLRYALRRAGVPDGGPLPADLTVVQVGDLVHRGPDSGGVLALVRGYLDAQPERWIQLVGNHESQYLPGGASFWPDHLAESDAALLRGWWADGRLRLAAAVHGPEGDLLVSHAGLTVGAWRELGEPEHAPLAARRLNERPQPLVWRGGEPGIDPAAGPLWAEAGWELYGAWMRHWSEGGYVPFGQVHGHSSIVGFADHTWRAPGRVRSRAVVDWDARQVRVRIGGRVFTGVDPRHGGTGATRWAPLILGDAEIVTAVPYYA